MQKGAFMMKMKTMIAAAMIGAACLTGSAYEAEAAGNGYVNLEAVIASSPDFQQASKSLASEQSRLQQEYNTESKSLSDQDKAALQQKLNRQLVDAQQRLMRPVQDKLRQAVQKAARDKQVDFVVSSGVVLYGGTDLTEAVKAAMK